MVVFFFSINKIKNKGKECEQISQNVVTIKGVEIEQTLVMVMTFQDYKILALSN